MRARNYSLCSSCRGCAPILGGYRQSSPRPSNGLLLLIATTEDRRGSMWAGVGQSGAGFRNVINKTSKSHTEAQLRE
jgi:hypothetical protein